MTNKNDDFNRDEEQPKTGKELRDYVMNSIHNDEGSTEVEEQVKPVENETRKEQRSNKTNKSEEQSTKYETRKKENNMVRKIVVSLLLALSVVLGIAGFSMYKFFAASLKPLNSKDEQLIQVEIPIGSSSKQIGQILESDHIIKSGLVFSYYVKMNNKTDFQAGFYQMSPSMTLDEITSSLEQGGTSEPVSLADAKITIPEGYTVEQIAEVFNETTDITTKEFMELMADEAYFNSLVELYPELLTSAKDAKNVRFRLEGYLYPATYYYYDDMELKDVVTQMVAKSNEVMTPYYGTIKEKGLTVQEVLTLASLAEKEGVTYEDRQKISQVFFNRLNIDMPIQSDIAVLYALEEHKVHLSNEDTLVESDYNLYIHPGTGPGPFNNPSIEAIEAVLNPSETDALYFLADVTTGKVYYAETYDEHLALKKEYIDDKME